MRLLLDVNVWVALLDDAHVHNTQALALIERPGLKLPPARWWKTACSAF